MSKTSKKQIKAWKEQLPDDIKYGKFEKDFLIDGKHYKHGAWNTSGDWWLAWNTDDEFQKHLWAIGRRT